MYNRETIGETLKLYRQQAKMSVNKVAEAFKEHNHTVATKTIYGWENGTAMPSAENLLFLCELYNMDNVLEAFGYHVEEESPIIPTEFEKELIRAYRQHPDEQRAVQKLLDLDLNR